LRLNGFRRFVEDRVRSDKLSRRDAWLGAPIARHHPSVAAVRKQAHAGGQSRHVPADPARPRTGDEGIAACLSPPASLVERYVIGAAGLVLVNIAAITQEPYRCASLTHYLSLKMAPVNHYVEAAGPCRLSQLDVDLALWQGSHIVRIN
jgi:hypothetical protein